MINDVDFAIISSGQIEKTICDQLTDIRLSRNMTQSQLSNESGVSLRTIKRLENGEGVTFDTIIRVLIALHLQQNLRVLLPDPSIRPIELIHFRGKVRRRARPSSKNDPKKPWVWGDETRSIR